MFFKPLRPSPVLVEQLRLIQSQTLSSSLVAGILCLIVTWVFFKRDAWMYLGLWAAAVWLVVALLVWVARNYKHSKQPLEDGPGTGYTLIALNSCFGLVWGSVVLLALDKASNVQEIMLASCVAGIAAGGMAFMAPLLPVYIGFATFLMLPIVVKFLLRDDYAYQGLGYAAVLYTVALAIQGAKTSKAYRNMIELRFDNVDLVGQLREQSQSAENARAEAVHANAAKSKFLAAASHDLRQPVHALGLFLEVLGQTDLSTYQRDALKSARSANLASTEMLNILLDFSRIEAGVVDANMQSVAVQPLLHKLEIEFAPQAEAKGLVYRSRDTVAHVFSDPVLLDLVLRNLVSNAIRYTEHGGVLVGCRQRGGQLSIEVWDTGMGIAPEHQKDVFQEFHQLGNPERDSRKGLGLGLAIAKGLVSTLGHRLVLGSRVGRGSKFSIQAALSITSAVPAAIKKISKPLDLSRHRVLIIEDDAAVRAGMKDLVQSWGAVCDAAESIDEALAQVRVHAPQLVISDYRLREQRTGAQAIAAVRAELGFEVPSLLVTGDTAPQRLRDAQATGVLLLHKPVKPADLHQAIERVLA
jgi:two-component system, sensor histidine kinase